ncbi:patatin family protein [Vibrio sp. UCD-FRSSP16_10]|uniref:patatin-like phospholipase family protein n=1 Tax=unclassified Vibrio TaxID=2614977 RepID=UPI0007FFC15C|nr:MULTISPECIES: patatin family protein [unclassified Vibrio]OBT17392.1 patatin family protein [Vibrio sp. UCD-FRSSP16_30]OBT23161.1 patatin family protein [Vibrio sp. UCD-FRSSP16_10]
MNKKALVVEGGAMRGIFAAGVLDAYLDYEHLPFDFAIGVSAGASNLLGFLAQSKHRNYKIITELATSKDFYSLSRFARGGNLTDVKWLSDASMDKYPIDLDALFNSIPFYAATTDIESGVARYFQVSRQNMSGVIEATTALPIAYKGSACFSGSCFTDGAVADSIPVKEAYRRGARDITVILSHPLSYNMPESKSHWLMKRLLRETPKVAETLTTRAIRYNQVLEFIRFPPTDATIRVIAPPENFPVKRLTRKRQLLDIGYQMGLEAGQNHVLNLQGRERFSVEECTACYAI